MPADPAVHPPYPDPHSQKNQGGCKDEQHRTGPGRLRKRIRHLSRPAGSRVVSLTRNGIPVSDSQILTLCMCDYRATGAGDFDFYIPCTVVRDIQTDITELILRYLEVHDPVDIPSVHPLTVLT